VVVFFSLEILTSFLIHLNIDESEVTSIICIIRKELCRGYYWNTHFFVLALFFAFDLQIQLND